MANSNGLFGQLQSLSKQSIAFAIKILKGPEPKYSATEGECFAVVSFEEHFRPYNCGVPFTLEVDHWALKWLMTGVQRNGRLARWALQVQEYDFVIRRNGRKGSLNANADALSRPPIACALTRPRVAALAVVDMQPLLDSDSGEERVTYATGQ
ncbi:TPA: hypothetical protein ACH3X1_016829 [Trebouxia sp. C0004]